MQTLPGSTESDTPGEPVPAALAEAARTAAAAMRALQRAAFAESDHPAGKALPGDFAVTWTATMTDSEFAIAAAMEAHERAADTVTIPDGHVYCYHCASGACDHATPPDSDCVFAGYHDTGRPIWDTHFNFLAKLDDRRVDQLFAAPPTLLARVVGRKRLIQEQLVSFGRSSLTYQIIGQVVAGYFFIKRSPYSLTLQVVDTIEHRLQCRLLAAAPLLEALVDTPERISTPVFKVHNALRETRRQVETLNNEWSQPKTRAERRQLEEKIFAYLRHLVSSIERKGRQTKRRTSHAEIRARQLRPIHKAVADLQHASDSDFFEDRVRNSIVVIGKGGRSHVFNHSGKHITSLILPHEKLERRRRRARYVQLSSDAVATFRDNMTRRV